LSEHTIIVNRGSSDFPKSFSTTVDDNNLLMIDLRDTLSVLEQQGINPNFWTVTKTNGHWNYDAHQAIGYFLSKKIEKLIISGEKKNN
jgi:hypothetical protein